MKKLTALLIVILSSLSLTALAQVAQPPFTDEGRFASWYKDSVKKMQMMGIMVGYPDGSFKPENKVNRAELAVILDKFGQKFLPEEGDEPNNNCDLENLPGLIAYLRSTTGDLVRGATIKPYNDASGSFTVTEREAGVYEGIIEGEGYYTLKIGADNYYDHVETIKLERGACHVIPQYKTFTLVPR